MVQSHDSAADSEIAEAQDIGSSEGEDEEHFSSPDSDSFERNEFLNDFIVGEFRDFPEILFS